MNWKNYLSSKKNLSEAIITIVLLIISLTALSNFLLFVEARPGVVLDDPLLNLFSPVDVTWLTFGLIYAGLLLAVFFLINKPDRLFFTIQLYVAMVLIRVIAMYLLPLEPPASMIILNDPFVEFFGTGQTLTKDLFFSGHTATLFLLFLSFREKIFKYLFLLLTVLVAVCVLLQHVHYSLDVFAAPFLTYAAYKILLEFRKPLKLEAV